MLQFSAAKRYNGTDCPALGYVYTGTLRLEQMNDLLVYVLENNVIGSYVGCGAWRGGSAIYARKLFEAYEAAGNERHVYVLDTFGAEMTDELYVQVGPWCRFASGVRSRVQLWANFAQFDLTVWNNIDVFEGRYDATTSELLGCINTMPIAVLHVDERSFEACRYIMLYLYPRVNSRGGVMVFENYWLPDTGCRAAVEKYLEDEEVSMHELGNHAVYFVKEGGYKTPIYSDQEAQIERETSELENYVYEKEVQLWMNEESEEEDQVYIVYAKEDGEDDERKAQAQVIVEEVINLPLRFTRRNKK
jgi:hypothetical protein